MLPEEGKYILAEFDKAVDKVIGKPTRLATALRAAISEACLTLCIREEEQYHDSAGAA
jgi:predicted RNA-binding protein YlqC (UPF0109 family)